MQKKDYRHVLRCSRGPAVGGPATSAADGEGEGAGRRSLANLRGSSSEGRRREGRGKRELKGRKGEERREGVLAASSSASFLSDPSFPFLMQRCRLMCQ